VRVTVLCFARLGDLAGTRETAFELPAGATVQDAWNALVAARPAAAAMAGSISCAVNAEFAAMGALLADHDEVAFLPPVSGGAPTHP
jgi:molybdopterin converting factor subunit 1